MPVFFTTITHISDNLHINYNKRQRERERERENFI